MTCTLPQWGDARANSPSGSAMEAPALSHRPCWSPIDPAQVSMFWRCSQPSIYSSLPLRPLYVGQTDTQHTLHTFPFPPSFVSTWSTTHHHHHHLLHHDPIHLLYVIHHPPPPPTISCTMIPYTSSTWSTPPPTMPGWVCLRLAPSCCIRPNNHSRLDEGAVVLL